MTLKVAIQRVETADPSVPLPSYASSGASGVDIRANLPVSVRDGGMTIPVLAAKDVPAGFRIELPPGFEAQVRPRSGIAKNFGITVLNSPGTIDSDYRGEVSVLLINLGNSAFTVRHGDRIAQLVIAPVSRVEFLVEASLESTDRGCGGFGSTGVD